MSELIFEHRQIDKNYIMDIKIMKVEKDKYTPEGIKYSLVAIDIKTKKRVLGFDNHERKGHHMHKGNREIKYNFLNEWKLIEDFMEEYKKLKGE